MDPFWELKIACLIITWKCMLGTECVIEIHCVCIGQFSSYSRNVHFPSLLLSQLTMWPLPTIKFPFDYKQTDRPYISTRALADSDVMQVFRSRFASYMHWHSRFRNFAATKCKITYLVIYMYNSDVSWCGKRWRVLCLVHVIWKHFVIHVQIRIYTVQPKTRRNCSSRTCHKTLTSVEGNTYQY